MNTLSNPEFREVSHSGGQLVIRVKADTAGRRTCQLSWQHCRPVAAAVFAVYALPPGLPLCHIDLGGMGSVQAPPPVPGAYHVFIGSDSEGKFGRQCPACEGYWRSDLDAQYCPYCGLRAQIIDFLTMAQRSYIKQYCEKMTEALSSPVDGDHVIDMDAVADASSAATPEKPAFYYAELSQQNRYTCNACGGFNDILGTFGYCAVCGTRNDFQELSEKAIPLLRDRINAGGAFESCAKEVVALFDSFAGLYVRQLVNRVPMTPARRNRLEAGRFHHLQSVAALLKESFDVDLLSGIVVDDVEFAKLMFSPAPRLRTSGRGSRREVYFRQWRYLCAS